MLASFDVRTMSFGRCCNIPLKCDFRNAIESLCAIWVMPEIDANSFIYHLTHSFIHSFIRLFIRLFIQQTLGIGIEQSSTNY